MTRLKILLTADIHLRSKHPAFPVAEDGASFILKSQREAMKEFVRLYRTGGYDLTIVAGDVTQDYHLDPACMDALSDFIADLNAENHGPVVILEGNHCIDRVDNLYTVMGAMKKLAADHVLVSVHQECLEFEDFDVWCVPYRSDYAGIERDIAEMSRQAESRDKIQVMAFHLPAKNAILDNGIESEHGVALTPEITQGFDICVGGDFHTHQFLKGNDKAFYIGSPFDLKFGESETRTFCEAEVSKGGFDLYHLPVPGVIPMLDLTFKQAKENPELLKRAAVRFTEPLTAAQKAFVDAQDPFYYKTKIRRSRDDVSDSVDVAISEVSADKDVDEILARVEADLSEAQIEFLKSEMKQIRGEKWVI